MSFMGEATWFACFARQIREQLRDKTLTAEQREQLETKLAWYEEEEQAFSAMEKPESTVAVTRKG